MTQMSRALLTLPADPGMVPSTHVATNNLLKCLQMIHCPLLDCGRHCRHVVHRHTCRLNIHAHKMNVDQSLRYR